MQMRVAANGISINYSLDGPAAAPVVTLSHSLAANLAMWEPQMAALTARYQVLRYDTRGPRAAWEERIRIATSQGMAPHVEPTIGRWFTAAFRDRHPRAVDPIRDMIRNTDPRGYIGCGRAIMALDLTDRLSAVTVPTLVVVGEDDPGTPVAAARTIHERIRGSELVVLKSASHLSNIGQAEAFNRAVTVFLARLDGGAPPA
jgi:3-oxoadipate enol-lactonase